MQGKARRQVIIYTLVTLVVSWIYQYYLITYDLVRSSGFVALVALMWIPGAMALLYRLSARMSWKDAGFSWGKPRFYLWAFFLPLVLALLTNVIAIPLGIKGFAVLPFATLQKRGAMVLIALGFGIFAAIGEEIGWRGFLLPKMVEGKTWNPYVLSSVVWALWHVPIVILDNYYSIHSLVLIALVYSFSILTSGYVVALLRVRSGSVWVPVLFHTSHNFFFQLVMPRIFFTGHGPNGDWWELVGSDGGVVVGLLYLAGIWIMKRRKV